MADSKNSGAEFFRVIGAFAVVCIHTAPFRDYAGPAFLYPVTNNLTRFAVPFFFTLSGYFFGTSLKRGKTVDAVLWKYCKRLALLFFVWSLFYLLVPHASIRERLRLRPIDTLFEGGTTHLWYFTALISALLGLGFALKRKRLDLFWKVALIFFGAAVFFQPYAVTHPGISLPFTLRNGPFFSSIFVGIGYWLSQQKRLPSLQTACLVTLLGLSLQELEVFAIWKFLGGDPLHDFTLGTLGFGAGMAMLALQIRLPRRLLGVAELGKYTLGIYLLHLCTLEILSRILSPYLDRASLLWQFVYPIGTFSSALLLILILFRFRRLRPIIS
jgi:surface polysaccharide O-acyltransferase-like enzyme